MVLLLVALNTLESTSPVIAAQTMRRSCCRAECCGLDRITESPFKIRHEELGGGGECT